MFVIKVEHWPHEREDEKREIASLRLRDTGTGDSAFANYKYELVDEGEHIMKSGFVLNFNTASSVWMLIKAAIGRAIPKAASASKPPIF